MTTCMCDSSIREKLSKLAYRHEVKNYVVNKIPNKDINDVILMLESSVWLDVSRKTGMC